MKRRIKYLTKRLFSDQSAQMLPTMALMLTGLLGMAALSIDVGRAYASYRDLQASTNASALAGAEALPNGTTATAQATTYSSLSGDDNAFNFMPGVAMVTGYPKLVCLTTLKNEGVACVAPGNANAIVVQQQVVVPMFFASLLNHKSLTLTATSTAAMRGAVATPYNVAIVVDTTESMNTLDTDSQCLTTRLSCALSGVQTLLQDMEPCGSSEASCGTVTSVAATSSAVGYSSVANSVDRVSLFTFPNVTVSTAPADYDCSLLTSPVIEPYTFPTAGASSYTSITPSGIPATTYQIIGYSSDYRASDVATALSTTSNVVLSVGGKSLCSPMQAPGGEGTYYAGAIYAAQASLIAEQKLFPGSQNVMIIISDGDASATAAHMVTGYSTTSGTYPSTIQQCAQAVTAAKAATTAGTRVYTVAYGAESSGCSTDTSPSITPCQTMQNMASAVQYFYSDYTQSGSGSSCVSASQPTTNLNQIFTDIATDFTVPRLIPNGTS